MSGQASLFWPAEAPATRGPRCRQFAEACRIQAPRVLVVCRACPSRCGYYGGAACATEYGADEWDMLPLVAILFRRNGGDTWEVRSGDLVRDYVPGMDVMEIARRETA